MYSLAYYLFVSYSTTRLHLKRRFTNETSPPPPRSPQHKPRHLQSHRSELTAKSRDGRVRDEISGFWEAARTISLVQPPAGLQWRATLQIGAGTICKAFGCSGDVRFAVG